MLSEYLSQNEVSSFLKYLKDDLSERFLLAKTPFSQRYNTNFIYGLLQGCVDFLISIIELPYILVKYSILAGFNFSYFFIGFSNLIITAAIAVIFSPLLFIPGTFKFIINGAFDTALLMTSYGLERGMSYAIDCPIEFTLAVLTLGARIISTLLFIVTLGHVNGKDAVQNCSQPTPQPISEPTPEATIVRTLHDNRFYSDPTTIENGNNVSGDLDSEEAVRYELAQ